MRVSKRETFLLFFLGLIAVTGAMIMFVLKPLADELSANQAYLEGLNNQKQAIEITLPNIDSLKAKLEKRLNEVSAELNQIEQPLNEAEFEHWILPLTTKYNMKVLQTEFNEVEIVVPIALDSVPAVYTYDIKTLVNEFNGVDDEGIILPATESTLLLAQYRYVVSTTYARYVYFLDEISAWNKSIYVAESEYDFTTNEASFLFNVYSIEQLQEKDAIDYTVDYQASGTGTGSSSEVAHPDLGK
ncbi:MAG: hypothetical protein VB012_05320 [Erysipelotrichaceae bacterium]|nr:hypothetical protein [Erysipelotrichaceae bacterium]